MGMPLDVSNRSHSSVTDSLTDPVSGIVPQDTATSATAATLAFITKKSEVDYQSMLFLEIAMESSLGETAMDVAGQISEGKATLWSVAEKGIVVTKIILAKKKVLQIVAVAGENMIFEDVSRVITALEQYGRNEGCDLILSVGRKGWARDLRKTGFRIDKVIATKEIFYA